MSSVTVTVDLGDITEQLKAYERDIPFLVASALTQTAKDVLEAEQEKMRDVFDRPVPWTLNSMFVRPALKGDAQPVASVEFKDSGGMPAYKYLQAEIEGGARKYKSHELALIERGIMHASEFAVPGAGVKLDAYGNMPGPLILQILSRLGAAERFAGALENVSKRSRKRHQARGDADYFLMRGNSGAADGIYQRLGGRRIKPVLVFVSPPSYGARFPAYQTATEIVAANFETNFWNGFTRYSWKSGPQEAA
jgi:hypothetical protein